MYSIVLFLTSIEEVEKTGEAKVEYVRDESGGIRQFSSYEEAEALAEETGLTNFTITGKI